MPRLRALAGLVLLAATGLLVPATAATAATKLTATITCDATTGAITTRTSGTLLASGSTPTPVLIEFQRRSGVRVTATASTSLPPLAQPFRVTTTATSAGDVAATGYTGTFTPATSLYYRETLLVTFKNTSSGATYATREATCTHDQRTTVALTCDPVARTVTATVTGRDGQAGAADGAGRPAYVAYHVATITQGSKDSPRFRGEALTPWDFQHRLSQAADGTWSDTGFVHAITRDSYYYAEEVTVGVFDSAGTIVGSGFARCTLLDGSQTSIA